MTSQLETIARCMRQSRVGHCGGAWSRQTDTTREEWLTSALAFVGLLRDCGMQIVANGAPVAVEWAGDGPLSSVDLRGERGVSRALRPDADGFAIVSIRDGQETVEQRFRLAEAEMLAGEVLAGNPEAMKRPGLGRMFAAVIEVFRLNAASLEGGRDA